MRRLNLSQQIAIIFLIAFIATYTLLAFTIVNSLDNVFEQNVFDQLESEGKELVTIDDMNIINPMFAFIAYSTESNIYSTSENIDIFISNEYAKLLINKAAFQENSISRHKNIIAEKDIYYVILNYEGLFSTQNNDIFIILTDDTLKRNMVKQTAIQILFACLLAFVLGYLIIYLWITRLVKDTKKIAISMKNIGKNHYKTKIKTTRKDEIGDLVDSIEIMREKIIENEKHKQDIIQGVSHDLKTPIAIIQSYTEALQDGIYTKEEATKVTLKQCDRLNNKVKKLLTLTRLGYLDINNTNFGKTDMHTLISNTAKLYKNKSNVKIITDLEQAEFIGDEDSWQIVLENLLDNAIRYVQSEIIITLEKDCFSVYNDGSHIPDDKIDAIFNTYEKGEKGNFGLGLSIVKKTVNLFGYIIIAENINDGVKFTVKLNAK